MRKTIAIDIDDVLSLNAQAFTDFSNERWGTELAADDYDDDWSLLWGLDKELEEHRTEIGVRANEFFTQRIAGMAHIQDAYEVLLHLKKHFNLVVVTSRQLRIKTETLSWIEEKFPGIFEQSDIYFAGFYDKINASSAYRNKGDLIRDLQADYLIDDQVKHCNAAAEHGIRALLFGGYAWHERSEIHKDVVPIGSWREVKEYFDAEQERISK